MYKCCGRRPPTRPEGLAKAAERQWASLHYNWSLSVRLSSIDAETTEAREPKFGTQMHLDHVMVLD
ncbi:Hypothetical protein FKW44_004640 [Caligus rogercresseyi]|uniref:Uncharacterized protein n=1 Tax=Caligus rogercresseyi TaxID=217165 RepID=A0A7T8HM72_CALRO|nr:Hypothetical protein FKW44_004640 [Caligus rogercresseyi]